MYAFLYSRRKIFLVHIVTLIEPYNHLSHYFCLVQIYFSKSQSENKRVFNKLLKERMEKNKLTDSPCH